MKAGKRYLVAALGGGLFLLGALPATASSRRVTVKTGPRSEQMHSGLDPINTLIGQRKLVDLVRGVLDKVGAKYGKESDKYTVLNQLLHRGSDLQLKEGGTVKKSTGTEHEVLGDIDKFLIKVFDNGPDAQHLVVSYEGYRGEGEAVIVRLTGNAGEVQSADTAHTTPRANLNGANLNDSRKK